MDIFTNIENNDGPPKVDNVACSPLFVCKQDILKCYGQIRMKVGGPIGSVTMTNCFAFVEDLDARIFQVIINHLEIGPKTIYSTVSQKVRDGFR